MAGRKGPQTFVPWYGSNRENAQRAADALKGLEFVGVAFAGGMCELETIEARTLLVNDAHRELIATAQAMADPDTGPKLLRSLRRKIFHPDELKRAQAVLANQAGFSKAEIAEAFYVACWMTRSDAVGTGNESKGNLCLRFDAGGGDSVVRYRNACRSLYRYRKLFLRCSFSTLDVFEWIAEAMRDKAGHGYYFDPPFFKAGRRYTHNAGKTDVDEKAWHTRLRDSLLPFRTARIVLRMYDHPTVRELYPETVWDWFCFNGRDQANNPNKPEVLIVSKGAA